MNEFSKSLPRTLPKQERFISCRRSCKGCGKALSARIAAKAVADTSAISNTLMPGIAQQLASLSSHAYAHDTVSTTGMIEKLLSVVEEINNASEQEMGGAHGRVQKAVIGVDRRVLKDDYLALTQVVANSHSSLFICFDSEPHMHDLLNKAIPQPFILNEEHIPVTGQDVLRVMQAKNMPAFLADADFSYVATACPSYPLDYVKKIKVALETPGNAFILVLTPCPTDWVFAPELSLEVGIKAVKTGYFPLYEMLDGSVRITKRTAELMPLKEFVGAQKRFITFPPELMPIVETAVTSFWEALVQKEGTAPAGNLCRKPKTNRGADES